MSAVINIKVTGLQENVAGFENVINQMPEVKKEAMDDVAFFLVQSLRAHVHRSDDPKFGPHMQDVIRLGGSSQDHVEVVVPTRYATIENARPGAKEGFGPHNFADMAQQETAVEAPNIFFTHYSQLFSNLSS